MSAPNTPRTSRLSRDLAASAQRDDASRSPEPAPAHEGLSGEVRDAIDKVRELQAARRLQERIRVFMASELDPETKLFGIALLFRMDDARQAGYGGVTLQTPAGDSYECTFETFDAVMGLEPWGRY